MIASIEHGYLLESVQSGMEDPKHWGIQCMVGLGDFDPFFVTFSAHAGAEELFFVGNHGDAL